MTVYESVLDAIGGTPLLRLKRLGDGVRPRIYAKLEFQNIGGSVKDRAALSMIRAAERAGLLEPGGIVVEGTSGNTGIGLSLVAAQLGYRSVIFAPAATAAEKVRLLRAFGADVHLVADFVPRSDPAHLANRAAAYAAATPGAWLALQYDNPASPAAHWEGTGPEIWADTLGTVTHLVASVGTGGTISGTGKFLKQASDGLVQVIAADPEHSRYGGGNGSLKYTEGAGHPLHPASAEDVWPEAFDPALVDKFISISDRDAIFTARRAAREEGLLIGATGGTALAAALNLAETLDEEHTIVVVLPDSGRNYLSTYFDDNWLTSLGFLEPTTPEGTVRSLLTTAPTGVQLLASGLTAAEAAVELQAREVAPDEPVFLVLDRGEIFGTVHPREVVGVVTQRSLGTVEPTAPALAAGIPYQTVAAGIPYQTVAAGVPYQTVAAGVATSAALSEEAPEAGTREDREVVAVLVDGRIAATLP